MAFGIQTEGGGGNYTPVVKINAKQGRVWRVDRSQDVAGNWVSDEVDITSDFQFVPDFSNIEIGWMHFSAGAAPDLHMVRLGQPIADRPSENHKQGMRLKVRLGKSCGGDIREIAATAKTVLAPFDRLHDAYLEESKSHPGKSPLVRMTSMKKIDTKTQYGTNTNFEPVFEIIRWIDTPDFAAPAANEGVAEPVRQLKTTTQVAPSAQPVVDEEEF